METDVVIRFEDGTSIAEMDRVGMMIVPEGSTAPFAMVMDFDNFKILIAGDPEVSSEELANIRAAAQTSDSVVEVALA
ncbi:MAG: hypothetical protein ACT452_20250 [Microthrixaceae bacterium]